MSQSKIAAGVAFDPDVLDYLRRLCTEFQRDRSFVINAIVRDYAQQQQAQPRKRERGFASIKWTEKRRIIYENLGVRN